MSAHGRKYWIKLYIELLNDDKVAPLNDSAYRRFIECLLLAGELDEGGYLPPIGRMAWKLRLSETALQTDLSHLAQNGLLEIRVHPDGAERWFITKFEERQKPSPGAERTREYRKRKKEAETETETYRTVTSVTKRHENVTESRAIKQEPSMTANLHPAVDAMYKVTSYWPGEVTHDYIIAALGDKPDMVLLRRANELWAVNRNKAGNFAGICDWYQELRRDPNWTPQARFKGRQATAVAPDEENIWTRTIAAIKSGKLPADDKLAKAIKAVGWSRLQEANQYNERQVREELVREYRNAITAAA